MIDFDTVRIEWRGPARPELEEAVRKDLTVWCKYMDHPSELMTHSYVIGGDLDGPCVHVWGEDGKDYFLAEYRYSAEWEPYRGLRKMDEEGDVLSGFEFPRTGEYDAAIEEAIKENVGERCPDFAQGCFCCEVWKRWDDLLETEARMKGLEK